MRDNQKAANPLNEELEDLRSQVSDLKERNIQLLHARETLKTSEERHRNLIAHSIIGIYQTTPDGRITYANQALLTMLGYASFVDLAKRILEDELYEPGYPRTKFKEMIEKEGKITGLESRWRRIDGVSLYIRENAIAIRDEAGNVLYYEGTVEDITEQKQAEIALKESERIFHDAINAMGASVHVVDRDLNILAFSTQLNDWIGKFDIKGDILGRNVFDLFPFLPEKVRAEYQQVFDTCEPMVTEEVTVILGRQIFTEARKIPIKKDDDVTQIMTIIRDVTEKKQAEMALEESENKFRSITENAVDHIFIKDSARRYTFVNRAMQQMLGLREEDILGKTPEEIFGSEQDHIIKEIDDRTFNGETVDEIRGLLIGNKKLFFNTLQTPLTTEDGAVSTIMGIVRDITERKKAESQREAALEALHESEARWRALIQNMSESVYTVDRDGTILFINHAIFPDLTDDEVIGTNIFNYLPEKGRSEAKEMINKVFSDAKHEHYETSIQSPGGEQKWISSSISPLIINNQIVAAVVIATDVTDSKYSEMALSQSEEKYYGIFEGVNDAIFLHDIKTGKIVSVNQKACEMYGYTNRELMELYISDLTADDQLINEKVFKERLQEIQKGNKQSHQWHAKDKDGNTFWIEANPSIFTIDNKDWLLVSVRNITDRKRAESQRKAALEALEHSHRVLQEERNIFVAGPVVSFKWRNAEGWPVEYVSPNVEEVLGYSVQYLTSGKMSYAELIPPEDLARVTSEVSTNSESGANNFIHEPYRIIRKDGRIIWIDDYTTILRNTEGEITHYLGYIIDITERRQAEEALRESEEKWRTLINNMPETVATVDRDGTILFVNHTISSRAVADVVGTKLYDYIHKKERKEVKDILNSVFRTGDLEHYESNILGPDGSQACISVSAAPLKINDKIVSAILLISDITDAKKAEEAIRESEEKFRALSDDSPNMIFINQNGLVVYVNKMCSDTMGYSKDEFLAPDFDFTKLIAKKDLEQIDRAFRKHSKGEEVLPYEYSLITKQGDTIDGHINAKLINYEGEKAILGVVTDITRRKKAEQLVQQYSEHLEDMLEERTERIKELLNYQAEIEKFAAVGRMAARIAHEINNPLAGVKNALKLVSTAVSEDHKYYPYVARIDTEIERIGSIIAQMYTLYKPEKELKSEFSIKQTVVDIISLLQTTLTESGVKIIHRIECKNEFISLPESIIRQIFYNLLANAIQASPQDGVVEIEITCDQEMLIITVIDHGRGIAEDIQHQIFEPFFTTKDHLAKQGLGLGLSITKSLVNSVNGSIDFDSAEDKGTTFRIALPTGKAIKEASDE